MLLQTAEKTNMVVPLAIVLQYYLEYMESPAVPAVQVLEHPFSITVFEDLVYWTDWHTHTIYQAQYTHTHCTQYICKKEKGKCRCCF